MGNSSQTLVLQTTASQYVFDKPFRCRDSDVTQGENLCCINAFSHHFKFKLRFITFSSQDLEAVVLLAVLSVIEFGAEYKISFWEKSQNKIFILAPGEEGRGYVGRTVSWFTGNPKNPMPQINSERKSRSLSYDEERLNMWFTFVHNAHKRAPRSSFLQKPSVES